MPWCLVYLHKYMYCHMVDNSTGHTTIWLPLNDNVVADAATAVAAVAKQKKKNYSKSQSISNCFFHILFSRFSFFLVTKVFSLSI